MRKNIRGAEWVNDEIGLYHLITAFRKHWWRFVLVFIVGLAVGYTYYLKMLPLPSSQIAVSVGFDSVKTGKYPDGSVFVQNDFINDSVIEAVVNNILELKNSSKWTAGSIKSALLVTPVYPLEIQLAKNQTPSDYSKLSPEVLANFERVMSYTASEYVISFSPTPFMPLPLQERVLSEIVRQYTDYAMRQRLPSDLLSGSYIGDSLIAQESYFQAYEYFSGIIKEMESFAALNIDRAAADANSPEKGSPRNQESHRPSMNSVASQLSNIRAQVDAVEYAIYDEKSLPNTSFVRKMIEIEIGNTLETLEIKKKQVDYKVFLAGFTKNSGLQGNGRTEQVAGDSADNGEAGQTGKSLRDPVLMLLQNSMTNNRQYYRMMEKADMMNDEVAYLQARLARLQGSLKRLDAPYTGKEPLETRTKALVGYLERANQLVKGILAEQANNVKTTYSKYQPPILNFAVSQQGRTIPIGKVFGVAMALTVIFIVLQMMVSTLKMVAERQKIMAEAEISSVQNHQISRKG